MVADAVQNAAYWLLKSCELSEFSHVDVAQVKMQRKWIVFPKCSTLKFGVGVEVRRTVAVKKRPIVGGKMTAGVLHGGGERIPVNHLRSDAPRGRQSGIKVINFKISIDRKRGELPAGVARKACPAVNGKGRLRRSPSCTSISGVHSFRLWLVNENRSDEAAAKLPTAVISEPGVVKWSWDISNSSREPR